MKSVRKCQNDRYRAAHGGNSKEKVSAKLARVEAPHLLARDAPVRKPQGSVEPSRPAKSSAPASPRRLHQRVNRSEQQQNPRARYQSQRQSVPFTPVTLVSFPVATAPSCCLSMSSRQRPPRAPPAISHTTTLRRRMARKPLTDRCRPYPWPLKRLGVQISPVLQPAQHAEA